MAKRIILCCDGTGQEFQDNKTNPLRLHYCLKNSDKQISFYDPGVGTFDPEGEDTSGGILSDLSSSVGKLVKGQGLGYGIVKNIEDGYRFLMQTYDDGDSVYLFGFSRGAFTAQAIAGLLYKCGLLAAYNENLIPYALEIYLTKGNKRIARDFKSTMCRPCKPKMLGVWDTVKSLGRHHQDDFFYENLPSDVANAFHALAIDEKRDDFVPSIWDEKKVQKTQAVEQVWFPGVHSDVGGGYREDGLANIALRWMIDRAAGVGVEFHKGRVEEFKTNPDGVLHESDEGLLWMIRGIEERPIPDGALVHESVKKRKNYKPKLPRNHKVVS